MSWDELRGRIEGGRIIWLHGFPMRIIVLCRVTSTGTYCSARMQRLKGRRWVFTKWRLYVCASAHFGYCERADRTRNLVVEARACRFVSTPPTIFFEEVPRLTPQLRRLEEEAARRIYNIIIRSAEEKLTDLDDELTSCLKCFGISRVFVDEEGLSWEEDDIGGCCYHRCNEKWRCARRGCSFEKVSGPPWEES